MDRHSTNIYKLLTYMKNKQTHSYSSNDKKDNITTYIL